MDRNWGRSFSSAHVTFLLVFYIHSAFTFSHIFRHAVEHLLSPAEAVMQHRLHGLLPQPAVNSISIPLHHPFQFDERQSLLIFDTSAATTQNKMPSTDCSSIKAPLCEVSSSISQQELQHKLPSKQDHFQDRRRGIFGPPIARFAPFELSRIVLPLRTTCGIKPTLAPSTSAEIITSPCAPGHANTSASVSPSSELHEQVHSVPHAPQFDMGAVSVGEIVGRGAFGEVYKATYMGTQVAVKQIMTSHVPSRMMQDIQSEFQKEVEVMQKLNHSNIVAYIGSSVVGNGVAGMMCYAFFLQCCVLSCWKVLTQLH
jgi:hypothetical protein